MPTEPTYSREEDSEVQPAEASSRWRKPIATRRPTVLIVESDRDSCYGLQMRLTGAGYLSLWANNSYTALEVIERRAPDLLFVDLAISTAEVVELLAEAEHNEAFANMATLVVGSESEKVALERLAPHRPTAYMQKPVNPRLLALRLGKCLEEHGQGVATTRRAGTARRTRRNSV